MRYPSSRRHPLSILTVLLLVGITSLVASQRGAEVTVSRQTALTRAIAEVSPAVAGINVVKLQQSRNSYSLLFDDPFWSRMFPPMYRRVESLGSGLVLSSDGYIVTNAHVVENAAEIVVTLPGGQRYEVVNIYTDELTDIALLKIDGRDLPVPRLGDSDQLMIGEWVVALGNPLGLFDISKQPTATVGIISGVRMDFGQQEHGRVYQDMIQTDASINPGNSGGPLVNADGQVVGINSFIFTGGAYTSGSIGIGFAIPINRAKEVVEELKTKGRVDRSFTTGIEIDPIDPWIQNLLGLPTSRGVLVTRVGRGSAGEEAGLKVGDVILEANGKRVGGKSDILAVIEENLLRAGDVLHLKIWRDGKARDIDLVLGTIER